MGKIDLSKFTNVTYMTHPLIKHKINVLRDVNTPTSLFREIVKEVAILIGYEALRDIKTKMVEFETPIEKTIQEKVDANKLCFVPILRAGLGMQDGLLQLVPEAHCGHIGLYRDEITHQPIEYYCKLPHDIGNMEVYLVDPMLATGGSAIDAVTQLKKHGAKKITFLCIIAAPEGVKAFSEAYPDVPLFVGALDRELNEKAYICPGLGDCGDRIFGTVK